LKHKGYADFYGTVYKSPSLGKDRDYLYMKVEKVLYQNKEEKFKGNLRVTVYRSSPHSCLSHIFVGDKIVASARLLSSRGFQNFDQFSRDTYFKSLNIHNRASTKSPLLVEKIKSGKRYSPLRWISFIRQKLREKIEQHLTSSQGALSPQGAVLEALLLGERGRMDQEITRALQHAGIFHLFAISGAHIAIISFLLFSLFRIFRIPTRLSCGLLMGFLIFYAFLVEGRPSVMRATIMTLAFLLGKILWSDVNLLNTISISAFLLLVVNPFSLFHVGFQLTFAATLSIVLFYPRIIAFLPRLPLRISDIFVLSLTAQLGILPIMATAFHRITFSSLILNFAAIPLVGIIMALGYIFLFFSFLSSFLAGLLSTALSFLVNLLLACSQPLDWLSFLSYRIPAPNPLVTIGYFLILSLLLLKPRVKGQRLIILLCFFSLFAILISYPFPSTSKTLKLTMIDVGQGESLLVEFPGRKKMLIDGGGLQQESFDIGENVVSPFLWKRGIKRIDYLVLTHAHPDHLNGLRAIARNFRIQEFWESFSPTDSDNYAELKTLLRPSVIQRRKFRGDSYRVGEVKLNVLHPKKSYPIVPSVHNNQSLVLRLTYGQISFLLTGDIEAKAESEILRTSFRMKSHVLKSPHHGSKSSSSQAFLHKVHPRLIIISVGEGNRYGLPDPEVLTRYRKIGANVFRTDSHGAIEVATDGRDISIRTASGQSP
jgi:competence protein ComEC